CPQEQRGEIDGLLAGVEVRDGMQMEVIGLKEKVGVDGELHRRSVRRRKWGLYSWRGGIGEATVFDELPCSGEMVQAMRDRGVYTAVAVAAEAVLVQADWVDGLLEQHHEHGQSMRFTFSQAPPGLLGCAYRLDLLHEMVLSGVRIGSLMNYDPDGPHADYVIRECNYQLPMEYCTLQGRLLADTQRGFERLERLIEAEQIGSGAGQIEDREELLGAMERLGREVDRLPRELEVEINTEKSLRLSGYPQAVFNGRRGEMSLELFEKIVGQCSDYDDVCLTIGGAGEPLAHGRLAEMVEAAKKAGIFGINIETDGRRLCGEVAERLLESQVDVVSVYLDATTAERYREIKGEDAFDEVVGNIERFVERSGKAGPMVVPHLVKTAATMGQMEEFYDLWIRKCGAAVIVGFNDYAGQVAGEGVMDMQPPQRWACERLGRCMVILADGTVSCCGQDFIGKFVVGNLREMTVGQVWRSEKMEQLRRQHGEGEWDKLELCSKCKDWFR
ncbi:MAG: SPASM domain-containing protein, partial [Sedimentisphaerales bacterium]|nr:SPASM domain-containing protein [Sedimentisphaerales bacterium]